MFLLERTVVGLMRLASRLMRREEISSMVKFVLKSIVFLFFFFLILLMIIYHYVLGIAIIKHITMA